MSHWIADYLLENLKRKNKIVTETSKTLESGGLFEATGEHHRGNVIWVVEKLKIGARRGIDVEL